MKRIALLAAIAIAIASTGCHKSTSTATAPAITITPTDIDLEAGTTTQFGETLTNETSTAVTWLINGDTSAVAAPLGYGTISTTGLYQAPTTPPSGSAVTVTVEVTADTTVFATASVIITPIPTVSLLPATATLAPAVPAAPTTFTASLFGLAMNQSSAVTWEVDGIVGGNATFGTIVPTGATTASYTPPPVPPPGGTVVVNVYLDINPTQAAGAVVTLTYAAPSVQGSYAFYLAGQNSAGFFARAGQFTASIVGGVGTFTGVEDVHTSGIAGTTGAISGTYTVGPDGRGTATLSDTTGVTNYYLTVISASQIELTEADNSATAHGQADLQTASSFNLASFSGGYAFDFFGASATHSTSEIGQFSATGAGGAIQNGLEDVNAAGTLTPAAAFSGSFGPINGSTGRGTAAINGFSGPTTFSFYMISPTQARFIETDSSATLVGDVLQQSGGTATTGFLSSLSVFSISGRSTSGKIAAAGLLFANGGGNLCTSLPTSSCLLDENNNGTVTASEQYTGSYAVAASGRGTATFSPSVGPAMTFVIYFVAPGQAFIQETDSSIVADGVLLAQRGGTFSTPNVTGSFGLNWTGAAPPATARQDASGQLTVGATSGVIAGTWDRNNALVLQPGIALTGSYALAVNGRGTVTLTDAANVSYDLAAYVANANTVFLVGTDTTLVFSGQLTRQF
jgi:hypothetical protein